MRRNKIVIALIAGSLAVSGAAYASGPQTSGQPHHAAHEAHSTGDDQSASGFVSVAAVLEQLTKQGYSGFTDVELDDGKYELEGRDGEGRKVEIDVDARTGSVIKVEQD